ncbi:hypothetical protein [unidentified bacterial endosymbiont]|uniref:hypothetical protein n=1 Tax=unidentified bacterial endosymbiont TaxID=2355 RepID=UPI00209CAF3F|nr:hypothetical protein [unidentified bacterial endosymbiont]
MSDVNNDYAFSTVHFSETQNYGPESTEGNRESTLLTKALISVRNSSHRLNKGSTLAKMPTYLNQSWQWLRTPSDNPVSVVNGSGKEETELQEILIEGEKLRRLGDLLRAPKTEETVPHGWRDSILKRLLIGISLIGASGYAEYRFYNASPPSGSQQNALPATNG